MRKEKNPGAGILDEFKAEALAYGFKLVELQIHPERKLPSPYERRGLSGLPERAEQILRELITKHDLKMCEALNVERRARGLKPVGDPAKLAKKKADFEKAYYGKLRHSEKGRRAVDVLRAKIWDDCARSNSQRAGITNPKGERTA